MGGINQKYALVSVFDKTGVADFAKELVSLGYKIISTGGTAKLLTENKISVIPIQEITGNPESFDGRMKTISFEIESGILFDRTNSSHVKQAKELKIKPIDIVACNLYPFEQTLTIENIDVGGPTMLRAAGKNFKNVLSVCSTSDYSIIINALKNKKINDSFRRELAAKTFAHLSFYDSQIAKYLSFGKFTEELTIAGRKIQDLRYGENPHQKASFYTEANSKSPLSRIKRLWGRELSLVNLTDINAGLESVKQFSEPAAVVIKHNSPSGIALGKDPKEALERAIQADPESAFGGVIVLNKNVDKKTAAVIAQFKDERRGNIDILAAPYTDKNALEFLKKIRKSMGIYIFGRITKPGKKDVNIKWVNQGFIIQNADISSDNDYKRWKVVTKKKPSAKQNSQMKIAWKFISRIRSNSIIVVDKNLPLTRGIGSGQTSRVRSTKIALEQAGKHTKGAVLASDSFFPFDDSVKLAAKHGISAIIQQGGSINDNLSIQAADKAGIAMVFTSRRTFWH